MSSVSTMTDSQTERESPSVSRRSALRHLGMGAAAAAGGLLLNPASAQFSGQAPAWHLGTFSRTFCRGYSFGIVRDAVSNYGLTIEYENGRGDNGVVVGRNDVVEVLVVSMAQGDGSTWFAVHAASSDSLAAETARNSIREDIGDTVFFDCG